MPPKTSNKSDSDSGQMPQIVERIKSASKILITVSNDPSIDQLAACIGLTLALSKHDKHATAVFSGKVPSTLEFLEPESTLEKSTNSLRDFIISLDKSKADKLRYKVEDDFVKIFITPYRTSIDEKDLAFSQGDFNIDLIITLGVHQREHLDGAIVAHGRILHDATVVSLNTDTASDIGAISWVNTGASSLCEMASDLVIALDKKLLDEQIATALLTGMVAETDRFGNEKAHPNTMSVSGLLMAAGASPQLIAGQLREPESEPETEEPSQEIPEVVDDGGEPEPEQAEAPPNKRDNGVIEIDHSQDDILIDEHGTLKITKETEAKAADEALKAQQQLEATQAALDAQAAEANKYPKIGPAKAIKTEDSSEPEADTGPANPDGAHFMTEPPRNYTPLTGSGTPEDDGDMADPLSETPAPTPLLERTHTEPAKETRSAATPPQADDPHDQTLNELEHAVNSPHLSAVDQVINDEKVTSPSPPPLDAARAAVDNIVETNDIYRPGPINSLGAQPVNLNLGHDEPANGNSPSSQGKTGPIQTPPPVPPPLMPPPSA